MPLPVKNLNTNRSADPSSLLTNTWCRSHLTKTSLRPSLLPVTRVSYWLTLKQLQVCDFPLSQFIFASPLYHIHVLPLASCWNSTHCAHYRWILNERYTLKLTPQSHLHQNKGAKPKQEDWITSTVFPEVIGVMMTKSRQLPRIPQTQLSESESTFSAPHPRDVLLTSCSVWNKNDWRWLAFWAVWSQDLRKEMWKSEFVVADMWAFQFFYVQEQYFQTSISTNHFHNHFHFCNCLLYDFFYPINTL